jgi:PAS domain S-box-containing protein
MSASATAVTGSPNKAGPDTRVADLEEQLRDSRMAEEVHQHTETGLRDALAYAQSIVDTVREPMLVLDGKLCVATASRAFHHTFGVSPEDTEGQFIYHLGNRQWDIPALRTVLEEVLPQQQSFRDFEVVHDFPSLGRRVMLLNGRELWREGNRAERMILLAIEDITERKRIEEELVRSNEDLQRFAYVAAHDLRSPLRAALNSSQRLARRLQGRLDQEEADMLRSSIESMKRLSALMHDILTYSEVGNAPQHRPLVALEEPLTIALANLQHHIETAGAIITVGALPKAPADRTQIAMVLQNLIGNAMKYRSEAPPRIHIDAVQDNGFWRLSVSDNGEGFNPEYAAQIFEPFKRLHGSNVPGSGIGLATCKRIVERLGGRIWAESRPGQGSTFFFTLPFHQG